MPSNAPTQPASLWRRRALITLTCLCITAALYFHYRAQDKLQPLLSEPLLSVEPVFSCNPHDPPRRVAIIGAGSGGSSAAYYINHYASHCPQLTITVYERNSYIGGRSTIVNAYDNPSEPVELGASIFVKVNHNLVKAAKEFGLVTQGGFGSGKKAGGGGVDDIPDTIGVYNGQEWRYVSPWDPTSGWWSIVRLLWQYGTAPVRTNNLMKKTVGNFLKMYDAPIFPFEDLTQAVRDVELADVMAVTGEEYLRQNGVGAMFSEDIIQASTRVNYAQNLDTIHGVETMVCMATDGAMSIEGGNWQIFAGMLEWSGAKVLLNTSVNAITRTEDGKYSISASNTDNSPLEPADYDTVILATPFQFANITLTPPLITAIPSIPYVTLHVTLFTSPHRLNPSSFNLPPSSAVPRSVLTTRTANNKSPGYYSISTLRAIINPATGSREYLYKIFSPAPLSSTFLNHIFGLPRLEPDPDTPLNGEGIDKQDFTWVYEKVWHSYPVEHPRATFEGVRYELEGGDGASGGGEIWYTSSIEGFISTMETSSLMGMNVARLVVGGWMGEMRRGHEGGEGGEKDGLGDEL